MKMKRLLSDGTLYRIRYSLNKSSLHTIGSCSLVYIYIYTFLNAYIHDTYTYIYINTILVSCQQISCSVMLSNI